MDLPASLLLLLAGCRFGGSACDLGSPEACWADGAERLRGPTLDLAAAARRFDQACRDGHLKACVDQALLLQDGRGVPRDTDQAVALYQRACDGGLGVGCANLAMMYQSGTGGVRIDPARAEAGFAAAVEAYRASCSGATPTYCANLGGMLESGNGTPARPDEAVEVWQRGCDGGDADACVNRWYHDLQAGGEVAQAIAKLREHCTGETPSSCGPLARAVAPSEPEAAEGFARRGCEEGDAQACSVLGVLLGSTDPAAATAAWDRSCQLGRAEGCTEWVAATLRSPGFGSPASRGAVVEHLGLACRIGDSRACVTLATGIASGELDQPDPERAYGYYEEACRMGHAEACVELLHSARDIPLDGVVRTEFLDEACARGVGEACTAQRGSPPRRF